jgi:polyhydroxyalkanoate synthesis regulator protein
MLAQIIRFYGGTLQGLFARYLEQSLNVFGNQQQQFRKSWGKEPLKAVSRMTQRNVEMWTDFQKELMRAAGFKEDGKVDKADKVDKVE